MDKGHLANSEDITKSFLNPGTRRREGPNIAVSQVSVQKAAVASFHCWQCRCPEIVGLLLGAKRKNKLICTSIIVGKDFDSLLQNPSIKSIVHEEDLIMCGVIFGSEDAMGSSRERALGYLQKLFKFGCDAPLFISAP